jgi:type VI secretion system protein ImpJ
MPNLPVHWFEGMFLRPHHFQAADRYYREALQSHFQNDHLFDYGVSKIKIETASLANSVLEIAELSARLKDGTFVSIDRLRTDLNVRLKNVSADKPLTVYLAVPQVRLGEANVSRSESNQRVRYQEVHAEYADESQGAGVQDVSVLRLQTQLLFDSDELNGYELLPLLQIRRDPTQAGAWRIEESFFPPSLAVNSWGELQSIVRRIYDLIGERLSQLKRLADSRNLSFSGNTPGDVEKLLMMHALNEAYAELSILALTPGVHPFAVYHALVRTIGRCSLFGEKKIVPRILAYDHDKLQPIFQWAWEQIRELIFMVQDEPYHAFPLVGSGLGMKATLPSEYLSSEWMWFFGIRPIDQSPTELARANMLQAWDWKLAASDDVERLFTQKAKGIDIKSPTKSETGLPAALKDLRGWLLWSITEDAQWDRVRLTMRVGVRVSEKQIANADSLEGNKRILLQINYKTYGLEMSLFAVRKRLGS